MRSLKLCLALVVLLAGLLPAAVNAAPSDIPPANMFQLPFPLGQAWTFNGVHGARKDAIDFSVGRPWPRWRSDTGAMWVVAAAPGVIRKVSNCGVEIDHADGWTTVYYHVEQIVREAGEVQANEKIAIVANTPREAACDGGYATAPHLHFALKRYGAEVPINGLALSGWRIHSGRGRYDSNCARMYLYRGEQRLCPYNDPVLNAGIPATLDAGPAQPAELSDADNGPDVGGGSVQIALDTLAEGAPVRGTVVIQGWAVDPAGLGGTGVDLIHLYLDGPAGQGTFLAGAEYGLARADVAAALGDVRYTDAGYTYEWDTSALAPGPHTLYIYAHSTATDWGWLTRTVIVQP